MSTATPTTADANDFAGMIAAEDVSLLRQLARVAPAGAIVEVGSYRGKSAISLATGAAERENPPLVYSIEPHAPFTGIYGGQFGGADRAAYYKAMLDSGCAEHVALINLPSTEAAKVWSQPIGLLFIDGDHRLEAVRADADAWLPHLVPGGIVAFDDAFDVNVGPYHVVAELKARGGFEHFGSTGKIAALRKL